MTITESPPKPSPEWTLRFTVKDRLLHLLLIVSFLGLSLTGIPLMFSSLGWAQGLGRLFGGYGVTGYMHRVFAVLLIGAFVFHLANIAYRVVARREWRLLWGPDSLVPQPKDAMELFRHMRWFVGLGPRPKFDRFSYWEKFDYWAVFWGMVIIGFSGLMLWFPLFFSRLLPGWMFNVALIIHGEEALLAMVFIFTVHFFNGNRRPEKFPMDTVIFDGRESIETLQHERPSYYERLARSGALEGVLSTPPDPRLRRAGLVVGAIAMATGLIATAFILSGIFFSGH